MPQQRVCCTTVSPTGTSLSRSSTVVRRGTCREERSLISPTLSSSSQPRTGPGPELELNLNRQWAHPLHHHWQVPHYIDIRIPGSSSPVVAREIDVLRSSSDIVTSVLSLSLTLHQAAVLRPHRTRACTHNPWAEFFIPLHRSAAHWRPGHFFRNPCACFMHVIEAPCCLT